MKRRPRILGAVILVVVVAVLSAWWSLDQEPEYRGKPLSYWLDHVLMGKFPDGAEVTFDALRSMEAAAAKPLVHAMTLTDSSLRRYYTGLRAKLPASLNAWLPQERLDAPEARNNAFSALCQMGRSAKGEVPELERLLNHPDIQVRKYAILVLACVGPDAIAAKPALVDLSNDPDLSAYAQEALRRIEGKAEAAGGEE